MIKTHLKKVKQCILKMKKKYRKPKPQPPKWFWADSSKLNYNFKKNSLKRKIFLSDEISKYLDVLIEK